MAASLAPVRSHARTWITAASLFVVSCVVGLWALHQTHRWPKGDGPHYAIMTSSLVNRGSFNVKPSYTSGDYIGVFSAEPLDFHLNAQYFSPDSPAWYTYHSFGLPLLLAPFLLAGEALHIPALYALQLAMVLLQALGVVLVYLYALQLVRRNGAALVAAITLLGSMSYLGLASSIYPDVLTATILVASLLCLERLRRRPNSLLPMAILSALAGFAPYLHVKTSLMSVTLLALGLWHWWRNRRSPKVQGASSALAQLACLLLPAGLLLVGYAVAIHAWYHTWVFTAPFSNGLLFHFPPGKSIIANLFDTSRGILPNNPGYLLILVGLPLWWQRDRRSALVTLVVLAPSLLLQSTFADWAGGCAPAGGRYLMPFVLATLPAVAFLFAGLRWAFRLLMVVPIAAGVIMGVHYIQLDFVCSYAGDLNPMLVDWLATHHIRPDFAIPIFSHDLDLNGGLGTILLLIGLGVALVMLVAGIVIAQRRSRSALSNSDDAQVGVTALRG
jgi:hypothetical protein